MNLIGHTVKIENNGPLFTDNGGTPVLLTPSGRVAYMGFKYSRPRHLPATGGPYRVVVVTEEQADRVVRLVLENDKPWLQAIELALASR